jgi:hypothetical protein
VSRPAAPLPSLAAQLRTLAARLDSLELHQIFGELGALKFTVSRAAMPTAPTQLNLNSTRWTHLLPLFSSLDAAICVGGRGD